MLIWNFCFDKVISEDDLVILLVDYIVEKMMMFCMYLLVFKIFVMEVLNGVLYLNKFFCNEYVVWMNGCVVIFNSWIEQGRM